MKRFFVMAAVVSMALAACAGKNPVLTVSGGQIQGVLTDSTNVMVYKGIPYAAAPVGDLRWREPQPVKPWEGVRNCDTFGKIAMQAGNAPGTFYGDEFYWKGNPEMGEDCLFLNVWAPAKTLGNTGAKLPVAMWIHGGAYLNGYGNEVTMDGDAWAQRGVILVTINYRLGVFGFLSHPELTAEQGQSGNYGTMDQIAALKWIHDNIAQFGGDPDNITVMGQSAGAMSVKTLMASPLSKDYIAKAIIQSGGGVTPKQYLGRAQARTQSFFDEQGKRMMDAAGYENLAAMRSASAQQLFSSVRAMMSPHTDGKVLIEDFDQAFYNGNLPKIPVMIGYNKDDMGMLAGESVDMFCAQRDSLGFPVYEYEFMRNLPGDDDDPEKDSGAFHSAELWYTFGTLKNSWRPFTAADYALSNEMVDAWTNFCKNGNPGWPAYKHDKPFKKEFDVK